MAQKKNVEMYFPSNAVSLDLEEKQTLKIDRERKNTEKLYSRTLNDVEW